MLPNQCMTINIPQFYCLLRKEYLYNLEKHQGEYENCLVSTITSIPGRAIMFNVTINNGAKFGRLPISALCWKECNHTPLDQLELWNCFSYFVSANADQANSGLPCSFLAKNGVWHDGIYMFTLDWFGSELAEDPGEGGYKTANIIKLQNGNFAAQPNNRCRFFEPSFITKDFPEKPDYKTNEHIWNCEAKSKWTTSDDDAFFYGIKESS